MIMSEYAWAHYLPASAALRDSGLSCRGAGEQRAWPGMGARRLSTAGLVIVAEGRGWYAGPPCPEPVEVVAPAVIWLHPGVEHRYAPDAAGWRERWVLFEGTAVRAYEALRAWRRDQPVRPATAQLDEAVAPLFAGLRAGTATPGRRAELLGATLTAAVIGLAGAEPERRADSAADMVVASAFTPASVAERARSAGLSTEQLRREVAEQTSLSVHELVIRTRVARAQQLLAQTGLGVAEIARQVGYDDAAYFSRLFTARVGLAPSAFRHQVGGISSAAWSGT